MTESGRRGGDQNGHAQAATGSRPAREGLPLPVDCNAAVLAVIFDATADLVVDHTTRRCQLGCLQLVSTALIAYSIAAIGIWSADRRGSTASVSAVVEAESNAARTRPEAAQATSLRATLLARYALAVTCP